MTNTQLTQSTTYLSNRQRTPKVQTITANTKLKLN
jgi:hypothetical protein